MHTRRLAARQRVHVVISEAFDGAPHEFTSLNQLTSNRHNGDGTGIGVPDLKITVYLANTQCLSILYAVCLA